MSGESAGVQETGTRSVEMSQEAVKTEAGYLVRFTPAQRVEHFVTMVDFVGLVATGAFGFPSDADPKFRAARQG